LLWRVVPDYQRLIPDTFGRADGVLRGPGRVWTIPLVHSTSTIDLRDQADRVEPQTAISKDNQTVTVELSVSFRVVEPGKIPQNYQLAVHSVAISAIRAVVGVIERDDIIASSEQLSSEIRLRMEEVTGRWGVKVDDIEVLEILPHPDIQGRKSGDLPSERNSRPVGEEQPTPKIDLTGAGLPTCPICGRELNITHRDHRSLREMRATALRELFDLNSDTSGLWFSMLEMLLSVPFGLLSITSAVLISDVPPLEAIISVSVLVIMSQVIRRSILGTPLSIRVLSLIPFFPGWWYLIYLFVWLACIFGAPYATSLLS
jgi:hypothetical protein